jgi:hypothetical protein
MKYNKKVKVNKYTLREMKRQKRADALKGDGEYLFVNNTRGDLTLEKPPIKGRNPVPPGQTFVGDSYFLKLMKIGDVRLIETLKPAECERRNMPDQKLILDQPNRFTNQGQTEHVVPEDKGVKPLLENQPHKPAVDKLITEDPLEGVEILLG